LPWGCGCRVDNLAGAGFGERAIAASSASLLERLRAGLEAERDPWRKPCLSIAWQTRLGGVPLRADATDYALPQEFALELSGKPDANGATMPAD
jgi:type III restriction enzyme